MAFSHRERVFRTIRGEPADTLACGEFFIADEFVRAFRQPAVTGEIEFQHRLEVVEALDLDLASVPFSAGWGALEQPDEDAALETLLRWHEQGQHFVFALMDGPFSAAARARGFNMLMHYIQGAPHAARELFRQGAEQARILAQAARDAGADGIILGEDIAYGRSTYVSPRDLRALYFPELAAAAREIRALGLAVFFHSDGNLNPVLGDLAACGLDGIQGLEPEAGMSVAATRAQVGPALTLWGNLGFDVLSAPLGDEQVARHVEGLTHASESTTGAARSRFIFGSSPGLVQGMNVETVRRVYRLLSH